MEAGFFSVYFTLDTMEVERSVLGMMVNPQYINFINLGREVDPNKPGFHVMYIGRNTDRKKYRWAAAITSLGNGS